MAPGYWSGMLAEGDEPPRVVLGDHAIHMCPLYDPAVLGTTPCGRLVYSNSTCESLLVHDGWDPEARLLLPPPSPALGALHAVYSSLSKSGSGTDLAILSSSSWTARRQS